MPPATHPANTTPSERVSVQARKAALFGRPKATRALADYLARHSSEAQQHGAPHPEAALLLAAHKYRAADARYEACEAAFPATGTFGEHMVATTPHLAACEVAIDRLTDARAATLEGVRAKAGVLERHRETEYPDDDAFTDSVLRDLIDLPDLHDTGPDPDSEVLAAVRDYIDADARHDAFLDQASTDWTVAEKASDAQHQQACEAARDRVIASRARTLAGVQAKAAALKLHRDIYCEDDDDAFTASFLRDLVELPDTGAVV